MILFSEYHFHVLTSPRCFVLFHRGRSPSYRAEFNLEQAPLSALRVIGLSHRVVSAGIELIRHVATGEAAPRQKTNLASDICATCPSLDTVAPDNRPDGSSLFIQSLTTPDPSLLLTIPIPPRRHRSPYSAVSGQATGLIYPPHPPPSRSI